MRRWDSIPATSTLRRARWSTAPPQPKRSWSDVAQCLIWVNTDCEIETLDAKYLRLTGTLDPATREWHVKDRSQLDALLQLAQGRGGAGNRLCLEQAQVDPSIFSMILERAGYLRLHGDDSSALDGLRNYWRCALLGNMCWQLAHTRKAAAVDLSAETPPDKDAKKKDSEKDSEANAADKDESADKDADKTADNDKSETSDKTAASTNVVATPAPLKAEAVKNADRVAPAEPTPTNVVVMPVPAPATNTVVAPTPVVVPVVPVANVVAPPAPCRSPPPRTLLRGYAVDYTAGRAHNDSSGSCFSPGATGG